MASKRMIVKVQLPLGGTAAPLALIYDKSRRHQFHIPITDEIEKAMDGSPKKFFDAEIFGDEITLGKEAAWQTW